MGKKKRLPKKRIKARNPFARLLHWDKSYRQKRILDKRRRILEEHERRYEFT